MQGKQQNESGARWSQLNASWQVPRSNGLAHLFKGEHVIRQGLAVGKLVGAVSAFGIEVIEKACSALVISIFTDVARLFRLVHVAALVKLNDLIVREEILEGLNNVG